MDKDALITQMRTDLSDLEDEVVELKAECLRLREEIKDMNRYLMNSVANYQSEVQKRQRLEVEVYELRKELREQF